MNLLSIIVIIILAIFMLRGYRKGLSKGLASMLSLVISLALVSFLSPYVSEFLEERTPVYEYVLEKCERTFSIKETSGDADGEIQATQQETTQAPGEASETQESVTEKEDDTANAQKQAAIVNESDAQKILESLDLPGLLEEMILNNNTKEKYLELAAENFYDYVPKFVANLVMNIISFIVTWIIVLICLQILMRALDIVNYIPLIGGLNRILGLLLGLVEGLITVWIFFLIITTFSNSDIGKQLMDMVAESAFLRTLYEKNFLMELLQNTFKVFV